MGPLPGDRRSLDPQPRRARWRWVCQPGGYRGACSDLENASCRSERGVVAVGVAVRDGSGAAVAALSVSMPSVRYEKRSLPRYVAVLRSAAAELGRELA
ncbi:IclR family transcriptional regulator C-terminal domain-containing protein [Nocardia sp. MDA0666]|uniref:IclR family transcriptional regulator domain-containing protein n=1 Tax=Nocardia sp. MDA0666 TaxID=2135448 RepID=UPI0035146287